MLGIAAQKELLPIEIDSLQKAIELNGVAIEQNLRAFNWGRLLCEQPRTVFNVAGLNSKKPENISIDKYVDNFSCILEKYQNKEYSEIFLSNVKKVIKKENQIKNSEKELPLSRKVALTLFRAMRYKDEYEVARLHTSGDFAQTFLNQNKTRN